MIIFKLILIILLLVILRVFLAQKKLLITAKFFSLCVFVTLIVFVIFPDSPTYLANKFGVNRGADLLFYLSHLLSFLIIILLWGRIQELRYQVTLLNRNHTIEKPYRVKNPEVVDKL